jgi:hypothetical protein
MIFNVFKTKPKNAMRNYSLLILILCLSFTAFSQRVSLKGAVADTVDKKSLENTVITLMRARDSVLVKFARADKSGNFAIRNLDSGKFVLMITHPYLGDYFDNIELLPGVDKDLGTIMMIPKSKLLAEVIVKSGSPIRIKGDTTVYTADSFRVRPGANVEELLRRLPGIQVDRNGQITAMGERVRKILVDGEEFFGSDPGIVAKNLRADNVKEVQVFDRQSEQAQFTGIDDGNKEKTINLKLKELKGYFGKVEAGGGLKDRYNTSAMVNKFTGKRKIAAYGVMSNTGQTNLDWQDAQNYGGGISGLQSGVNEDGGIYLSLSQTDETSYYGGRNGIPINWNGGLHYNNKFNNDKLSLNGGYKFSKVNSPGVTRTFSENFFPDTSWSVRRVEDNFSSRIRHELNMTVEATLDSNNSLRWTTRANHNLTRSDNSNYSDAIASNDEDTINTSLRNTNNDNETNSLVSTLLWRHKFKKIARTLSINTDINWNRTTSDGLLYSLNKYYSGGTIFNRDTVDQQNVQFSEAQGLVTRIAYTEPLMKDTYMELSYGLSYNNNVNDRITNIKSTNGKYETRIDTLSNSFTFKRLVNTPGVSFRVNKKKYNFNFGASVGFSRFDQENQTDNVNTKYNFVNFFPRAAFQYKFKPNETIRFNYNGSTQAPSLEQLQPIRINTDPLNIYLGNQDLDQSFRHNASIGYNFYNPLKERGLWISMNMNLTQNAFTQANTVDQFGKRTYQTVNADGVYNVSAYVQYYFKIPDTKWQLSISPNISRNRNVDFVSNATTQSVKNITINESLGTSLNISHRIENKYNFYVNPTFRWTNSEASVNATANAKYWQLDGWVGGEWYVPGKSKLELRTDLIFQARQKDPRFPANNNFTTWNAHITKRLWKNEFEIDFAVFDILSQNRGYQRNFNSYSFTETYYNTLTRFWLLTFTWNFSKNGKPAQY